MKKISIVLLLFSTIIVLFNSCSKSNEDNNNDQCAYVSKTWSVDVSPIINSFCNQAGCHNSTSTNGPGPLTNHSQVYNARTEVRDAVSAGRMPQNTTLTTAQKNAIICWIDNGAPNN